MSASVPCLVVVISLRSAADPARHEDEDREQRERRRGEAPVEQDHRGRRGDDRRHVGDDRGRGRGDDALDAADVVCDPRLHLAGARPREEGERQALEVLVDGGAQVVHHALADEVRLPGLGDADHAGDDRDRDHPGDQDVEARRVDVRALCQDVVQEVAQEERRDDAEPGRDHDQAEQAQEARPVGLEEPRDPAAGAVAHRAASRLVAQRSRRPASWARSSSLKPAVIFLPTSRPRCGADAIASSPAGVSSTRRRRRSAGMRRAQDPAPLLGGVDERRQRGRRDAEAAAQLTQVDGAAGVAEAGQELPLLHRQAVLAGDPVGGRLGEPVDPADGPERGRSGRRLGARTH